MSVKVMLIEEGKKIGPFGTVLAVPHVGSHIFWKQSVSGGEDFIVTKVRFIVREDEDEANEGGPKLKEYVEVYITPTEDTGITP